MNQPFLSLNLIVRDAAETIKPLLDSVQVDAADADNAFSEFCIVDTGSVDSTRPMINKAFGFPTDLAWPAEGVWRGSKVLLRTFEWIDDFAAARNFCFAQGSAKWRMWLDADDVLPQADLLKAEIEKTERLDPSINCIFMKYDYAGNEIVQDKCRIVRWADGWQWKGVIHEDLERFPHASKRIAVYASPAVKHAPKDPVAHGSSSLRRNLAICERVRQKALIEHDAYKAAHMSYYIGPYLRVLGDRVRAKEFTLRAAEDLGPTNLGCLAYVELAKMAIEDGAVTEAVKYGGLAVAAYNSIPDGWGALGVALVASKRYSDACRVFDTLRGLAKPLIHSMEDKIWNEGIVWSNAATAYLYEGRVDFARESFGRISKHIALNEAVWLTYSRVQSDVFKAVIADHWLKAVEILVWNNEPVKALKLLEDDLVPSNILALPVISQAKKAIWDKMQQMVSWPKYVQTYGAECNEVFDRDEEGVELIRAQDRAKISKKWAESLPKEGEPVWVYTIGIHGGWIEEDMLEANPRVHFTACDVNPNANTAIQRLMKKYPGRVDFHAVVEHHYDWIPKHRAETYDAVICFEVIEHVPDDHEMVKTIANLLKPGGELLLSTPVAEYWVAPDATKRHHWHQHVRAYQPEQLWDVLKTHGFSGDLSATDGRILHFAHVKKTYRAAPLGPITIWVPSTPQPFDVRSPQEGHLGGSEEAVIHLSRELSKLGHDVTVWAPRKERQVVPHVDQNVLWRPAEEIDPVRLSGPVLVWRSPKTAAALKKANPSLRVLNWLHDVSHQGVTPADYATVDGTVVVSAFHARAIEKYDGYSGPFMIGANGIDPAEFAELAANPNRDPHLAIYASAPNRGLDLLLAMWPDVRKAVPDAKLEIYYDWTITEQMMARDPNLKMELGPLLKQLREDISTLADQGVRYIGGVGHAELHQAYSRAGVWAYPCHSFEETYCISAVKAQAAGCIPVTFDTGALPEVIVRGAVVGSADAFREGLVSAFKEGGTFDLQRRMTADNVTRDMTWARAAERFSKFSKPETKRIAILADRFSPFTPNDMHGPNPSIAGSEEAVILLSQALVKRGYDVQVFVKPGRNGLTVTDFDGVKWINHENFTLDAHDVVIVWRDPARANDLGRDAMKSTVISWLMDPSYVDHDFRSVTANAIVALTENHARIAKIPKGSPVQIIHNGLQLDELPPLSLQNDKGRHPEWVMWSTSPDRGLIHLLRMWPNIRKAVPGAQLHIFYGIEGVMARAERDASFMQAVHAKEMERLIREGGDIGIVYHGRTSRTEMMAWHTRCGTFAFTCDGFEETFSIATVKAQACGLWPVVSELGALPEVLIDGDFVLPQEDKRWDVFEKLLIDVMQHPAPFEHRKQLADRIREKFSIDTAVAQWEQLFKTLSRSDVRAG